MTYEEKYPNIAKLTALLNQQEHPRQTLNAMVNFLVLSGWKSDGTAHNTDIE